MSFGNSFAFVQLQVNFSINHFLPKSFKFSVLFVQFFLKITLNSDCEKSDLDCVNPRLISDDNRDHFSDHYYVGSQMTFQARLSESDDADDDGDDDDKMCDYDD